MGCIDSPAMISGTANSEPYVIRKIRRYRERERMRICSERSGLCSVAMRFPVDARISALNPSRHIHSESPSSFQIRLPCTIYVRQVGLGDVGATRPRPARNLGRENLGVERKRIA
jgi:hypothetical protein